MNSSVNSSVNSSLFSSSALFNLSPGKARISVSLGELDHALEDGTLGDAPRLLTHAAAACLEVWDLWERPEAVIVRTTGGGKAKGGSNAKEEDVGVDVDAHGAALLGLRECRRP